MYDFVSADKASNNVIIWRLYYIDVLKQETMNTRSYISENIEEKAVVSE